MGLIQLPYKFDPRFYQEAAFKAFDEGIKRLLLLWHRRAGKDKACINLCARESQRRVGSYYYFLPTYQQGKKIIWEGIDGDGFAFLNHFPKELIAKINNTEMRLTMKNGSIFRIIGCDNIDSIVGTNPVGCVFSEYALQDPQAWDFIRPILRENKGWAIFPYTPRGKNHGYDLYEMAIHNPDWFVSKLDINDTHAMTEQDVQDERDAGMDEELIQQEFYCSFKSPLQGSYYSKQMDEADDDGRITAVPHDPDLKVDTWWDLGMSDSTAIVFTQTHFSQIRAIDYHEAQGEGFPYYAKMLEAGHRKKYNYGVHIGPHDLAVRELGTGKSRIESARQLGINFEVARRLPLEDGINAVRSMLPQMVFDKEKCGRLVDALRHYHKEYDPINKVWKAKPKHDWSSHPVDAVRTGAVGRKRAYIPRKDDRYSPDKGKHKRSWMTA